MTANRRIIFFIFVSLCAYLWSASLANKESTKYRVPELKFILPDIAAQLLSFGDPYLVANMNYSRVVTLFNYEHGNIEPRSKLLVQGVAHNPKQLDMIYQSAIIPWEGQIDKGIEALAIASEGRYWDWVPVFMLGVTHLNFRNDYDLAADYIATAGSRAKTEKRKKYLNLLASQTHARSNTAEASLAYIEGLIAATEQQYLKDVLEERAEGIRILFELRAAAEEYTLRYGRQLESFDQLLESGILKEKPRIIGLGYKLNSEGIPELYERIDGSTKR